jgi:type IV pilus assembly protein PilQ
MKSYSNKFLLALLVIFISSCDPSSVALNKNALLGANESSLNKDSLLIDTERFIANKRDQVVATAETGPNIKNFMAQKASVRKQINKEVRKNNTDVDSNSSNDVIFPITINFENISIKDMSIMFSEITGRNILIGDEVQGMVSAKLDNVPWDKALDSILKIKKLAKYVDDEANIIRIHSQAVLVEQEAYDLEIIEAMKKTKSAKNSSEPIYTEIFKLYYTKASQISTEIQSVLNSSSNEGESASDGLDITIDERLNYLIVKATKPELDLIETLIAELDVRTKQILIEAFIVEASEDLGKALGATFGITAPDIEAFGIYENSDGTDGVDSDDRKIDLTGSFENLGSVAGNAIGLILGTSTKNLSLALAASETKGVTKVLSNPRVFTLDGQKAEIKQVDQIPYTKVEEGVTSVELKEAGITLIVTPVIVGDGNIILTVEVEKSTVDTTVSNPPIAKRTITTKLLIQNETIVVIGGVFTQSSKDSQSKTPILGDIPFIGNMFKKDQTTDVRKEILVFLAPTII